MDTYLGCAYKLFLNVELLYIAFAGRFVYPYHQHAYVVHQIYGFFVPMFRPLAEYVCGPWGCAYSTLLSIGL